MNSRRWPRLRAVPLLVRLMSLHVVFAVMKHVVPLRTLVRWASQVSVRPGDPEQEREIIARVLQAGSWSGAPDRDCVQRSVVLYRELIRIGRDPHLVMGIGGLPGARRGHAWVTLHGSAIAEANEGLARFAPVVEFAKSGYWMRPMSSPTVESPSVGSSSTN